MARRKVTPAGHMNSNHSEQSKRFREATGTAGLEQTLRKAVRVLSVAGIAHLVMGGYAVQEHGYLRFTDNVDLIVPNVSSAHEWLCKNGFAPHPAVKTIVVDPELGFEVRLYQGGSR
jgi:hypothetical protein